MDLPPGPWLPAAAESLVDAAAARLTAAFTANTTKGSMCVPPAPHLRLTAPPGTGCLCCCRPAPPPLRPAHPPSRRLLVLGRARRLSSSYGAMAEYSPALENQVRPTRRPRGARSHTALTLPHPPPARVHAPRPPPARSLASARRQCGS